jgi:hypothetical protein
MAGAVAIDKRRFTCMVSCMATKTISLEMDAYERLKQAKRGKESFSAVVRRARFDAPESTGAAILAETEAIYGSGKGATARVIDYWDKAETMDAGTKRVSPSEWSDV